MEQHLSNWLLPPNYNSLGYAQEVDRLIAYVHIVMVVMFVVWGAFFVYCLIRFRHREGHKAQYEPVKGKLAKAGEIAVIVAEALLLVVFSMPAWAKYKDVPKNDPDALTVRIIAEQFSWNVHYPGKDGVFGRTDVKFVDNVGNSLGIDPADPAGKDDIVTLNEFHFPVNKTVIVNLSSKDVIHSFTINVLRVKQDVIPGMLVPVWFQANTTGEFDISCAQLCGLGHYRMRGTAYIDTPEQYAKWMTERESELQGANQ